MTVQFLGNTSVATIPTLLDIVLANQLLPYKINSGAILLVASVISTGQWTGGHRNIDFVDGVKTWNRYFCSMSTWVLLILIGLTAGVLSGFFGIGGGLILVPALVYIMGYQQHQAQGTSLGVLLLPVVIMGAYQYWREGYIDVKAVLLLALGFVIGGYLGSQLALKLNQVVLQRVFAIFLIFMALKYLIDAWR
jgi:hypothetical protein